LDILDQTPLLDTKPHVPFFDCFEAKRIGWLQGQRPPPHLGGQPF
jgi:tRNA (Thr-GGU) A37 N-methylase